MAACPICGSMINTDDKECSNCGFTLPEKPDKSVNPPDITISDEVQTESEEDKRKKWLEQQKSVQDELSGIKSSMKDDQVKAEDQNQIPLNPYPIAYPVRPDVGILSRNYGPLNLGQPIVVPVNNLPYSQPEAPGEKDEPEDNKTVQEEKKDEVEKQSGDEISVAVAKKGDEETKENNELPNSSQPTGREPEMATKLKKPENLEVKVAMATPIKKPAKIKVKPKDIINVESIIEDVQDIEPRQDREIAGAIDKILSHEKDFKIKPAAKKPKEIEKVPSSMKRYQIKDILKYLRKTLRKTSDRFNRKPIENLIAQAQKKLDGNNIEAAYSIAINAKKTFNKSLKDYENARKRLKHLRERNPGLLSPANAQNQKYENILTMMKNGEYSGVLQHLDEIERSLLASPVPAENTTGTDSRSSDIPVAQRAPPSTRHTRDEGQIDWDENSSETRRSNQSQDYARWKKKKSRKKRRQ
jgi:hypothetical protein